MRKLVFLLLLFSPAVLEAQTSVTGRIMVGTAATRPATCAVGDTYNASDTGATSVCTAVNTWGFKVADPLTVSGTTTLATTNVNASDAVTAAAMFEPFKANVNSANSQSIFQSFYSPTSYNSSPITGAMICPSGATKIQCTSVIGLMDVTSGASGTAGVALGGYARSTSTNAHTFGLNSNASDCTTASCGSNITSTNLIGYEADCNANLSGSACTNILVRGVYNTGATATGIVYAQPLGTKGVYDFGLNFQTNATAAPGANNAAIFFNPVATGATQVSQGMEFQSTNGASTSLFAGLNLSAAGNLSVATSGANTGFLAPMLTAGNALCTGAITGDGCVSRSTTTGAISFGSDGNVILFRNGANSFQLIGSSFGSNTTGFNLGYTTSPWNSLILGTAGTNAFSFNPAATTGARAVVISDPGVASSNLPLFGGIGAGDMQTKRTASCTTGATAASTCTTTVSWTTAFADANYTVACTIGAVTNVPYVLFYGTKAGASVVITIANLTAAAASGTIDCKAQHD